MEKVKSLISKKGSGSHESLKPIKLYSHAGGPNPWKVAIILSELGIPYDTELMDFADLKKEPYESINPNGRVPAIEDPNTGYKVWESGAIIEYLLENYDKTNQFGFTTAPQKWEAKSWLHFQMSGQGPYFGQRAWFVLYHQEKDLTSVLDRYGNEIKRVMHVIDQHLSKTGGKYLVGDKVSYADLSFMPWHWLLIQKPFLMGESFPAEWEKEYPKAWAWSQMLNERPAVKKVREERNEAMSGGH